MKHMTQEEFDELKDDLEELCEDIERYNDDLDRECRYKFPILIQWEGDKEELELLEESFRTTTANADKRIKAAQAALRELYKKHRLQLIQHHILKQRIEAALN